MLAARPSRALRAMSGGASQPPTRVPLGLGRQLVNGGTMPVLPFAHQFLDARLGALFAGFPSRSSSGSHHIAGHPAWHLPQGTIPQSEHGGVSVVGDGVSSEPDGLCSVSELGAPRLSDSLLSDISA